MLSTDIGHNHLHHLLTKAARDPSVSSVVNTWPATPSVGRTHGRHTGQFRKQPLFHRRPVAAFKLQTCWHAGRIVRASKRERCDGGASYLLTALARDPSASNVVLSSDQFH
uniref:DUF1534 domain-containing protein n=1 Tax=Haemonchus contortus TaxID=6289 RepID=A0A7I4YB50_HAECO